MSDNHKLPDMPSRVLTLDPTRKDAGTNLVTLTIIYDVINKTIQVRGSAGLDTVGQVGILELAKNSVLVTAMRRPS